MIRKIFSARPYACLLVFLILFLYLFATPSFAFLLCLEGEGTVTAGGMTCPVARADGYYLPAGLGEVTLEGNMTVLVARMG